MTTTDVIIGSAIALLVLRQVRATFLEHLHADRPTSGWDLAQIAASGVSALSGTALGAAGGLLAENGSEPGSARPRGGWGARARWAVSVGARLAFFGWLYDVTDGAALSPFGFAQDLFGGTVWRPVLVALGLSEVVARLAAVAVRATRRRTAAVAPYSLTKAPAAGG